MKQFFAQSKKILEKDDDELIVEECGTGTVQQARDYESRNMFMRLLYAVSKAHQDMKRGLHEHDSRHIVFENYNYTVSRDEFV